MRTASLNDLRRLPSRDKFPCYVNGKHCEKRYPACQDKCPDMAAAKKTNDERKAIERRKRQQENAPTEYSIIRNLAAARRKMKER